jgi:hypothetical protein
MKKMKFVKNYNEYRSINEAWYHNLLASIALLGGVSTTAVANQMSKPLSTIEKSINNEDSKFFAACLVFTNELSEDVKLDERTPYLEARQYFQDRRDGINRNLQDFGEETNRIIKAVIITVGEMDTEKVDQLGKIGMTAKSSYTSFGFDKQKDKTHSSASDWKSHQKGGAKSN